MLDITTLRKDLDGAIAPKGDRYGAANRSLNRDGKIAQYYYINSKLYI